LDDFFFHVLELVDVFSDYVDVGGEDLVELIALDGDRLSFDHGDVFVELACGLLLDLLLDQGGGSFGASLVTRTGTCGLPRT